MSDTENKKIYEVGYHILPTLTEEEVAKVVSSLKEQITELGAEIISDQYPVLTTLAYEMEKVIDNKSRYFGSAYFGWIKFEVLASAVEGFKESMEKNLDILRFIIIKTVRESTLAVPKLAHKGMSRRSTPEAESATPIDEEEVDKKIEEMIDEDDTEEVLPEA